MYIPYKCAIVIKYHLIRRNIYLVKENNNKKKKITYIIFVGQRNF